jgi:hypothetical protein
MGHELGYLPSFVPCSLSAISDLGAEIESSPGQSQDVLRDLKKSLKGTKTLQIAGFSVSEGLTAYRPGAVVA